MASLNQTVSDCHTLVDVLRLRSRTHGDALAYRFLETGDVDGPRSEWTWAEVDRRARRIAARLQDLDLAGERALLIYPPGLEYVGAF